MSLALIIRPRAERDLAEAGLWYESRSTGTGSYFLRCVDAAMSLVIRHAEVGPIQFGPFRRVLVRRFPFGVLYTVEVSSIIVHGVFHLSRDPICRAIQTESVSCWRPGPMNRQTDPAAANFRFP